MKLIIDSGGTKTDWAIVTESGTDIQIFTTPSDHTDLTYVMPPAVISRKEEILEVHMYGAGMYSNQVSKPVQQQISKLLPSATVHVYSDLLGCCRATAGAESAIVCILGTGSNSCVYDGKNIVRQIPALGFVMSDEGSGVNIGRALIKAYLYGEMDKDTSIQFKQAYGITKSMLLENLQGQSPAAYLASYARFPNDHPTPLAVELVREELSTFVQRRVLSYDDKVTYPVHFVGSIAYFYSSLIKDLCHQAGLRNGLILQKPINGLITYHK